MKIIKTLFDSVKCIEMPKYDDARGAFIKWFDENTFAENGISVCFKESYFSISDKNVIRGMHFQIPPQDHEKLVCVSYGSVKDVILDIRKGSPTYGKARDIILSADNHLAVFIPRGFAHGFVSLENRTIMNYLVSSVHSPEHDQAIRYDSFDYDWNVKKPVLSERDKGAILFQDFNSLFRI